MDDQIPRLQFPERSVSLSIGRRSYWIVLVITGLGVLVDPKPLNLTSPIVYDNHGDEEGGEKGRTQSEVGRRCRANVNFSQARDCAWCGIR